MKNYLLIPLICLIPFLADAQATDSAGRFGFVLNASMNGTLSPVRIVPSVAYGKGNSQLEVGVGLNPFGPQNQRIISGECTYKYFPNGTANKFNLYLITHFAYVHNLRKYHFPSTYTYLFLDGGYGFQTRVSKRAYIGTDVTFGTFTYRKRSENPYDAYDASQDLWEEFGFTLAFQVHVGYRI